MSLSLWKKEDQQLQHQQAVEPQDDHGLKEKMQIDAHVELKGDSRSCLSKLSLSACAWLSLSGGCLRMLVQREVLEKDKQWSSIQEYKQYSGVQAVEQYS